MESRSHTVPRTMAAPVTTDSISPAHPLTFTVVWASWPSPFKGLLLLQSASAHTLREYCEFSSSIPVLCSQTAARLALGWSWSGREGRELQLQSCQPGHG